MAASLDDIYRRDGRKVFATLVRLLDIENYHSFTPNG
jgi:hypothetical protein